MGTHNLGFWHGSWTRSSQKYSLGEPENMNRNGTSMFEYLNSWWRYVLIVRNTPKFQRRRRCVLLSCRVGLPVSNVCWGNINFKPFQEQLFGFDVQVNTAEEKTNLTWMGHKAKRLVCVFYAMQNYNIVVSCWYRATVT